MHDGIFRCKSPPGVESLNVWRRLLRFPSGDAEGYQLILVWFWQRLLRESASNIGNGMQSSKGKSSHGIQSKVILLTSRHRQKERDHVTGYLMFISMQAGVRSSLAHTHPSTSFSLYLSS